MHTHIDCPACGISGGTGFYRTAPVPVHSCLMLEDEAGARAFPRRPMELAFCAACGFVFNAAFDPAMHDYAGRYEDQQSFSKRFRDFQAGLIRQLIERYDIRHKTVVEIGCGKGDFLLELCREGGNRGVGIDPRCDARASTQSVRFVPEYFGRQHRDIACDLLACRHTLEHIHETGRFLDQIREALQGMEALVFFEVPDARRVFRELAFWDIYYEHCAYFTPGSLVRTFRGHGFEVLEVGRVFEDQYLTLVTRPAEPAPVDLHPIEEEPSELAGELEVFAQQVSKSMAGWKSRLGDWARERRRVALWGAGSKCVSFLSTLECESVVETIIDINPHQQHRFLPGSGKRIMPPDALRTRRPDVVLVMNPVYRDEIGHQLEAMGVHAELMCV